LTIPLLPCATGHSHRVFLHYDAGFLTCR
jgi:hypothetical protein